LRRGEPAALRLRIEHALADRLVLSKLRARLGLNRCRFLISGGAPRLCPVISATQQFPQ